MAVHFLAGVTCIKYEQHVEIFSERIFVVMAINDTGVFPALPAKTEEIVVVGHDDPILVECESDVIGIVRAQQARVRRCGNIDALCTQADGNARMDMLIQVEANRHGNRGPGESGRGAG